MAAATLVASSSIPKSVDGGFDPKSYGLPEFPADLQLRRLSKPIDGRVFYYTNEDNRDNTRIDLTKKEKVAKPAHVGFSTLFNYDIIALRRSEVAFICDVSERVFKYYEILKEAHLEAKNVSEFINILSKKITDFREKMDPIDIKPDVLLELLKERFELLERQEKGCWLNNEDDFQYVKQMYENNQIYHVCLDAADENKNFETLAKWIKDNGYTLDTLYLSNIHEWIIKDKKPMDVFKKNVQDMIDSTASSKAPSKTSVIDATEDPKDKNLVQHCHDVGKNPY